MKYQWNICSLVEHADKTYERPQNSEAKCHGGTAVHPLYKTPYLVPGCSRYRLNLFNAESVHIHGGDLSGPAWPHKVQENPAICETQTSNISSASQFL